MTSERATKLSSIESGEEQSRAKAFIINQKWKLVAIVCALATILVVSTLIWYFTQPHAAPATDSAKEEDKPSGRLKMVSRKQWTAQPPENPIPLNLPAERLIIAHTNTSSCSKQAQCSFIVRKIQSDHVEDQKMSDIAYNFLIGSSGLIYYGRGWDVEGQHSEGFNAKSLCVAMIGTYDAVEPSSELLEATEKLIDEGIQLKKLATNYRLYGQQQLVRNTTSPGQKLYEILVKQWSHWTADVK